MPRPGGQWGVWPNGVPRRPETTIGMDSYWQWCQDVAKPSVQTLKNGHELPDLKSYAELLYRCEVQLLLWHNHRIQDTENLQRSWIYVVEFRANETKMQEPEHWVTGYEFDYKRFFFREFASPKGPYGDEPFETSSDLSPLIVLQLADRDGRTVNELNRCELWVTLRAIAAEASLGALTNLEIQLLIAHNERKSDINEFERLFRLAIEYGLDYQDVMYEEPHSLEYAFWFPRSSAKNY